jgi:hypothetical protein
MKVRDMITALLNLPMDDDLAVQIRYGASGFLHVPVANAGRINNGNTPFTAISLESDVRIVTESKLEVL